MHSKHRSHDYNDYNDCIQWWTPNHIHFVYLISRCAIKSSEPNQAVAAEVAAEVAAAIMVDTPKNSARTKNVS